MHHGGLMAGGILLLGKLALIGIVGSVVMSIGDDVGSSALTGLGGAILGGCVLLVVIGAGVLAAVGGFFGGGGGGG